MGKKSKKNKKYPVRTRMTVVQAMKYFANNEKVDYKDYKSKTTALTDLQRDELERTAKLANESKTFIDTISKQRAILPEGLHNGYIGKIVTDNEGIQYLQTTRGKPYGSVVAVFNKDTKKIYVGYSLLDGKDEYTHPVIGQAFALKKALENEKDGITIEDLLKDEYNDVSSRNTFMNGNTRDQLSHFKDRAYRFFMPDVYASNGSDPLYSKDFETIKAYQLALKCMKATNNSSFGLYMSEFRNFCKAINSNIQ